MALFSYDASAGLNYLFDILPLGRCKETNQNMFALLGCTSEREKNGYFLSVSDLWHMIEVEICL